MGLTVDAIYDGEVLRPQSPLNLRPNQHYSITIDEAPAQEVNTADAWSVLDTLAGTIDAPSDWSAEHDHYIHGTPKQGDARGE